MSKTTAQCDELRAMAESIGLAMPQAATLMMSAANAIEKLEDENAKLRNEVDNLLNFEHLTSVAVAYAGCDECGEYKQTMLRLFAENAKLRELATYALKHIIEFECEEPDLKMFRGKPCEDCADAGSSDCPKCMPRMFDVSGIEVDK